MIVINENQPSLQANYQQRIGTTDNVNTPFNCKWYQQVTEIKITDPRHPLFGRKFPVLSICEQAHLGGYIIAAYPNGISLRLPISATDLAINHIVSPTKLTSLALEEFFSLAKECQLICQTKNLMSGNIYPQNSNKTSSKI
jgi:hypothetical protein